MNRKRLFDYLLRLPVKFMNSSNYYLYIFNFKNSIDNFLISILPVIRIIKPKI